MTLAHKRFFGYPGALLVVAGVIVAGYMLTHARAATTPGDINNDGTVNVFDLSILLSHWGGADAASDINGDGTVNVFDLSVLLSHWGQSGATPTPTPAAGWYKPPKSTTWQWQIDGGSVVNENAGVQMYDIDMQDAMPAATADTVTWPGAGNYQATVTWPKGVNAGVIDRLHTKGIKVMCYTDTGAFENYRPDAALFPGKWGSGNTTRVNDSNAPLPYNGPSQWAGVDVIGGKSQAANGSTFAGEFWLDQRQSAWQYWEPIMVGRMKLAKQIGCDGMEGDQNNAYGNDNTFGVTQTDSLKLFQEMFYQQHQAGLGALAKNGIEIVPQMLSGVTGDTAGAYKPDGFLNEECNYYSECADLATASAAGYWVGQVEYTENGSTNSFCAADTSKGFMGMLKHLALGTYAYFCWNGQTTP
jgi:hypothetical protein